MGLNVLTIKQTHWNAKLHDIGSKHLRDDDSYRLIKENARRRQVTTNSQVTHIPQNETFPHLAITRTLSSQC
jgi:hypothetical protein